MSVVILIVLLLVVVIVVVILPYVTDRETKFNKTISPDTILLRIAVVDYDFLPDGQTGTLPTNTCVVGFVFFFFFLMRLASEPKTKIILSFFFPCRSVHTRKPAPHLV